MASLWGGRFEKDMDDIVKKYNASIFFHQRMYNEDIEGSIAHVTMLGKQGIVSEEEKEQIIAGLKAIRQDIAEGKIVFNVDDEDIHMGIESRLIERIGDVGKKLHQIAVYTAYLATDQLGHIRILLLGHNAASGAETVVDGDIRELRRIPPCELLRPAGQMHHGDGRVA